MEFKNLFSRSEKSASSLTYSTPYRGPRAQGQCQNSAPALNVKQQKGAPLELSTILYCAISRKGLISTIYSQGHRELLPVTLSWHYSSGPTAQGQGQIYAPALKLKEQQGALLGLSIILYCATPRKEWISSIYSQGHREVPPV